MIEYHTLYIRNRIKNQPLEKNNEMKEATLVSGKIKKIASFINSAFSPFQAMYKTF
jgi:hypothetical protein